MDNKHNGAKKKEKNKTTFRKIRTVILFIILLSVVIGSGIFIGMFAAVSEEIENLNIKNASLNFSSFIYCEDENGNYHQVDHLYEDNNRIWVDSEDIPDLMKDAIISIEDERFYSHFGVDIKRTTGAFIKWTLSKIGIGTSSYGGSTITQQLVKNITQESEVKPSRKIKEMMRAIAIERELSKDEILTMYLNVVYFANNCYGVQAAANVYFDKNVDELSLSQIASIVGITQKPSAYDPFKHLDKNLEKRNLVLSKMLELGKITQKEYDTAYNEKLEVNTSYRAKKSQVSSYFVDQVISDVISDLQTKRGYSETYAKQQLYNGGLKVYTTMDLNIQTIMENVFTNTDNFPKTSSKTTAQSAMVVIDPYTGEIKGVVGGLGKKTESRGLNRATQSKRQPGSALKPLAVYAPAYDNNTITSSSILKDEPVTYGNWSPKNSYSGFKGDMTVRKAIEISSNIPAVKVVSDSGINNSFNFLKNKLYFSYLDSKDMNLSSLGLGGLTNGVTVKEMAAGYSIFVNGGKYVIPYSYTKVVDYSGKVLLENTPVVSNAISEENSYIISNLLSSVVNGANGTGRAAKLSKMPTFGKTGTTNEDKDRWFVGFTPYYVGAVWYGFDQPQSIKSAGVSYNASTRVWKTVMEQIHKNLPVKNITMPGNVIAESICTESGLKASSTCPSSTEYFVKGTQPKTVCSLSHSGTGEDVPVDDNEEIPNDIIATPTPLETPPINNDLQTNKPQKTTEPVKTQDPLPTNSAEIPVKTPKPTMDTAIILQ